MKSNTSINEFCVSLLNKSLKYQRSQKGGELGMIVDIAQSIFPDEIEGVVLFGSQARGDNTNESDIDILIVLKNSIIITKDVYLKWDQLSKNLSEEVSVHFVNLPQNLYSLSGLWCEVSLEGIILFDDELNVSKFLVRLRDEIFNGSYKSAYSHGHRYWRYLKGMDKKDEAA